MSEGSVIELPKEKKKITSDNCPFEPLEDHVLVRQLVETKTKGGIMLPQSKDPKDRLLVRGEVLAVGPGRILDSGARREPPVKPGDVIFYPLQAHNEMGLAVSKYLDDQGFEDPENVSLLGYGNVLLKVRS